MLTTTAKIVAEPGLPDGEVQGFDVDGNLILHMRYAPTFARIVGTADDERDVATWRVSPAGARRIDSILAWSAIGGHPTAGNA